MAEAPLPRLPPKSPFLRLVRIAPPASAAAGLEPCRGGQRRGSAEPAGRQLPAGPAAPERYRCPDR